MPLGLFAVALLLSQSPATCGSVVECRQQALAAATAGDYEAFHDLAWRAVQKGRPNDPELMTMLARAQALSGRPGDALVMLQRLADMGVAVDVSSEDFRRVKSLNGWPELEAKFAGRPAPPPAPSSPPPPVAPEKPAGRARAKAAEPPPTKAAVPATPSADAPAAPAIKDTTEEALTFDLPPFDAVGLAYDAVSRRFIVGDRKAARLMVIDEMSHHVTNLVSAASAGFYAQITAFEIDARRGDLWVASAAADGRQRVLHKLQLVSGRVLEEVPLEAEDQPSAFVDIAIAADGTILALERDTSRIMRLHPRARTIEEACRLEIDGPRSIALADDRVAYVSSDDGIVHVDLSNCSVTPLHAARGVDLSRVDRLRWQNGALVLVQRTADDQTRIARARVDGSGKSIGRLQVVAVARHTDPTTSTIAGPDLYYLVSGSHSPSIRKARLR